MAIDKVDGKMKTMDDLRQFLERRARALEASTRQPEMKREALGSKDIDIKNKSENYQSYQSTSMICSFCKQSHRIYTCPKFLNLSIADKYEKVKQLRLCFNCLKEGHGIKTCTSKSTCQKCKRKHHSLLHREEPTSSTFSGNSLYHKKSGNVTENNNCSILLPTAIVSVLNSKNQLIPCRALLDSGSQLSFITQALSRRLNLNTTEKHLNLSGIGGQSNDVRAGLTNIVLKSVSKEIRVSAYVLKQLTTSVPSKTLQLPKILERYKLADPDFRHSQPVDMILGTDVFEEIIENERKETVGEAFHCHLSIDDTLRRFWEIENVPEKSVFTDEENSCENFFQSTTNVINKRFGVKLPFREDMHLGESLTQAESRFKSLERRFDRNPDLRKRYSDFINEFISLDHMKVTAQEEINKPSNEVYYIPHHCVFKEDSTTTKLRVVFDGSAKTSNGVSLNESLMIGPVVQNDLFTILNRFRFRVVALSADIAKMYRQVELDSPDEDIHRLLWRNSKNEEIQHLRMKRVTYGIASSAFHSKRCLKEVASQTQFESVANALNNCFYVDDFLGGADSIEDARNLVKELCLELSKFGFELRKWTSCHYELTMELPLELRETSDQLQLFSEEYKIKTLGICWKPISDTFIFSVDLDDISQTTKRTLLSDSSKVFDPIGWIAPVIIAFKCLIQQTWVEGISWDEKFQTPLRISG